MANNPEVTEVINEIMRIAKKLPPRPELVEVMAAKTVIKNVEKDEQTKLDLITKQIKPKEIPEELFYVFTEMQKVLIRYQSKEQMRESVTLLDLENAHKVFDEMLQRASQCVSPGDGNVGSSSVVDKGKGSLDVDGIGSSSYSEKMKMGSKDDSYVTSSLNLDGSGSSSSSISAGGVPQIVDLALQTSAVSAQDGGKFSLNKLASLIEVSAIKGTEEINLRGKFSEQVELLPDNIGKLSSLITLDLSENRIVYLPETIQGLSSLSKFDLHANRINELPESIGALMNLVFLDLRGNSLVKLPPSIGRLMHLQDLDVSSNSLSLLPDTIGSLVSLKKLNVRYNILDELPYTIGQCTSLQELRVDYNKLKALPEAVGKMVSLEILSMRYNNIRQLPTTMSALTKLRELDASFNELEAVPESLCFATTLVRLDVSNNFANLRFLPRSIGNLEFLEVLDIKNNQIRVLPDSFGLLSRLNALDVEQNPLEVPPREIAERGAQDAVQYMAELVANRDVKAQSTTLKKTWGQICCFIPSNKRNSGGGGDNAQT